MAIYLDCWLPSSSSGLPGDDWENGQFPSANRLLSCLTLHRMGVADPSALLRPLVVSYTAVSPLLPQKGSGLLSVALIQAFTRFRVLPDMLPCGVRTFLGCNLPAAIRLTWFQYNGSILYDTVVGIVYRSSFSQLCNEFSRFITILTKFI